MRALVLALLLPAAAAAQAPTDERRAPAPPAPTDARPVPAPPAPPRLVGSIQMSYGEMQGDARAIDPDTPIELRVGDQPRRAPRPMPALPPIEFNGFGDEFRAGAPCADASAPGVVGEGPPLPTCLDLPPRPPSAAGLVPFAEGDRWDFVVEREWFFVSGPGSGSDTLGVESWRVEGTAALGGRSVPRVRIVRAGLDGTVVDQAVCAVTTEVEALDAAYWDRWEASIRSNLERQAAQTGQGPPSGPPPSGPSDSHLMAPQELVTLRFETLEGRCPEFEAVVAADPQQAGGTPLLVGTDRFEPAAYGISKGAQSTTPERFESTVWLVASGLGPYHQMTHVETPDGRVENRTHRLMHATVGAIRLGQPLVHAAGEPALAASAPEADALAIESAGPNPFRERLTLTVRVPVAGRVAVEVYDVLGRRISRHELGEQPAGVVEHVIPGAALASGVYSVRVEAGEQATVRRVTRVH